MKDVNAENLNDRKIEAAGVLSVGKIFIYDRFYDAFKFYFGIVSIIISSL